jgi:hypothetical protein
MGIRKISERIASEMYDEMLDDCEGPVNLCGMTYSASHVLREVDPTAYRCGFNDYVDSLLDDNIFVEGLTDDELMEDPEDDGQPDEAQEWESFDPDC